MFAIGRNQKKENEEGERAQQQEAQQQGVVIISGEGLVEKDWWRRIGGEGFQAASQVFFQASLFD